MSHFSTLRTKITDGEALRTCLHDLGLNVKINTEVRGDSCQHVRADIVVVLEGEYDIGWSQNPDGAFDLIGDLRGVARRHNQTELVHAINYRYALNRAMAQVKSSGHTAVVQSVGVDGFSQVVVRR